MLLMLCFSNTILSLQSPIMTFSAMQTWSLRLTDKRFFSLFNMYCCILFFRIFILTQGFLPIFLLLVNYTDSKLHIKKPNGPIRKLLRLAGGMYKLLMRNSKSASKSGFDLYSAVCNCWLTKTKFRRQLEVQLLNPDGVKTQYFQPKVLSWKK